ncbi:MAG: hypothetical protein DHS20C14_20470 [Phycisphaeraceae bacterium]|nr:MAG: hypothetical protein DHS20C14_20470 [Phycisphaeraceae bacterium]
MGATAPALPVINITADVTNANVSSTITWTVSITGLTASQFLQAYDLNLIASCDEHSTATSFTDALTPIVNPTPGTPTGASIFGVSGGQSTILNPLGTLFGDVALGSFTTHWEGRGTLSYSLEDGGILSAPVIRIRTGSDFGPVAYEGLPTVNSDEVLVLGGTDCIPAPHTAALLALGAIPFTRRRRKLT